MTPAAQKSSTLTAVKDRPPPKTEAERQRARRRRRAVDEAVLAVTVKKGETADRLVEAGFLAEWSTEDPTEIAKAIAKALEKLLPVTRDQS